MKTILNWLRSPWVLLAALAAYVALLRLVGQWAILQRDTITVAVMGPLFVGGLFLATVAALAIGRAVWRFVARLAVALLAVAALTFAWLLTQDIDPHHPQPGITPAHEPKPAGPLF